jgi:Icc protein
LKILHITDPHLHAHPAARMRGVCTWDTFVGVLDHALGDADTSPDAIVATGDLVQDETADGYGHFHDALCNIGVPVYVTPGNHDAPGLMSAALSAPPFQCCGTALHDNWALFFLNTFAEGDDGGRLGAAQLKTLDRDLAAHAERDAVIFLHHHPMPMGCRWLDGVGLRDAEEFTAVVDAHSNIRSVVWGHVHQASDRTRNDVRWLSTPSTCAQFLPKSDDFALDTRPPGYRWLQLGDSGSVDTQVIWLD